ncbi:MAG: TldD/PmbA family protein, partial [Candidatus Bathyarchaeota archaeon]|nr:TldD/PmbA family protein [Candidatus Bathyarchaeota archaeon]
LFSRRLIDFEGVGDIAAKRAVESLGAEKLQKPEKLPVIFDNYTSPMFLSLLSYGVSAMSVQEGRSALIGKLGEKIAWQNLTVMDDSWMEDGLNTTKYDAEGIPTTVKPVIEKGVLKNYLYDSYTAHFEKKESTGNARRRGEAYLQTPTISPVNYYVEPGSKSLEELVAEVDEGLLVRYSLLGAGHSNYISGDFSVVATNPFYIKDGSVANPLYPVTIAGNAYEALMKIVDIGSDLRLSSTGKTPSILVSDLTCTP